MTTNCARFLCYIAMIPSIIGCADHRAATNTDTWLREPALGIYGENARNVTCVLVKPDKSVLAERHLSSADILLVSADQVADYTTESLTLGEHAQCFLVRGLYLNRETGHFIATFDGRDLYISHISLGHHAVPMKRQALLVVLPIAPRHVYVTVSMAE